MSKEDKILAALEQQNQYLHALLALQARGQSIPAEVTLAAFGLGPQEIGKLIAKKPDAVRMLVKRYNQAKNL